jgi:hypothetical protein
LGPTNPKVKMASQLAPGEVKIFFQLPMVKAKAIEKKL